MPRYKSFRPSLLGLEARRVMDAGMTAVALGGPVLVGPLAAGTATLAEPFDPALTVSFGEGYQGKYVQVDGSDHDDVVTVLDYRPGSGGLVSLRLEQYSNGVLLSSRTVRLHADLTLSYPVRVEARGGNDKVINDTSASMIAYGGTGFDVMLGGSSYDILSGNHVDGRDGDDYLIIPADESGVLYGGWGNDNLHGGDGIDLMYGGPGNDSLYGNGGADTLYGGADVLSGGAGVDILLGDDGTLRAFGKNEIMGPGVSNRSGHKPVGGMPLASL